MKTSKHWIVLAASLGLVASKQLSENGTAAIIAKRYATIMDKEASMTYNTIINYNMIPPYSTYVMCVHGDNIMFVIGSSSSLILPLNCSFTHHATVLLLLHQNLVQRGHSDGTTRQFPSTVVGRGKPRRAGWSLPPTPRPQDHHEAWQ
jgi:hypothetical protein